MIKLMLLLMALMLLSAMGACAAADAEPAGPAKYVAELAAGETNKLKTFTPTVTSKADRFKRHVPMVYVTTPWDAGKAMQVEVPEYVHGWAVGDRRKGFLFAGRSLEVAERIGGVRHKSLEAPAWRKLDGGGLALDTPLAGGLTVRFRVVPHDRLLEVRFGLTNQGEKAIRRAWAQLCFKGVGVPALAERHPTSSHMLSGGKLVSWDGAGQDLTWLAKERHEKRPGQVRRSCFFLAEVGSGKIRGRFRDGRNPVLTLGRKIDVPAIAKADANKARTAIVYSPSGVRGFYNVLQPCFHVDPHLGDVPPKTTRWTQTYVVFLEGDLEAFMKQLSAAHRKAGKAAARKTKK